MTEKYAEMTKEELDQEYLELKLYSQEAYLNPERLEQIQKKMTRVLFEIEYKEKTP